MDEVEGTTPLKDALFSSLGRGLARYGFARQPKRDIFVRQHGEMTDFFAVLCLDAKPGYRIDPCAEVRIERVENIFHQTSGFERKYQAGTATMGAPLARLIGASDRVRELRLTSESQIRSVTEGVIELFEEFALPYFARWSSLDAIDAELNVRPGERTIHRGLGWDRCATGIIVAKLIGRPNYRELAAFYHDVMARDNKGFYLKRFEALLSSLDEVETRSGHSNA